jgi:excisionase family DNA binding protein
MVDEPHLTVRQAAAQLQVKEATVRRWLRTRQVHGTYLSDRAGWRIPASEVRRVLGHGLNAVADGDHCAVRRVTASD